MALKKHLQDKPERHPQVLSEKLIKWFLLLDRINLGYCNTVLFLSPAVLSKSLSISVPLNLSAAILCLSVYVSVSLSVFLSVCLSVCLSLPNRPFRSSQRRYSVKKEVLTYFAKFTGKHLCQSLFLNKAAGLRPATLLRKRLWPRFFPVNFAKFIRTTFLQNFSGGCFQNTYFENHL